MLATRMQMAASATETFTPADLTGWILYYDAEQETYTDLAGTTPAGNNDQVNNWGGLLGTGIDAVSASLGPTLITAAVNGRAALRGNGTNSRLNATLSGAEAQPFTIFAAAKTSATGAHFFLDSTTNRVALFRNSGNNWAMFAGTTLADGAADTDWHIFTAIYNGASSTLRVDGAVVTGNPGSSSMGTTVRMFANDNLSLFLNGDIAIIGVIDGVASSENITDMEGYLASEVGVSYPFDLSFSVSSPVAYKTFQRGGLDTADIPISGNYSDNPTAIEARFNGGSWATIDASPAAGTFSGTLSGQAAGQGLLEVRYTNSPLTSTSVANVGIGDVFLAAGQSNSAGMFTNSQSYSHASLKATVYDEADAWRECTDPTKQSALFGSVWPKLATLHMAAEGVPVAFITTGQGGTGLVTPDADWAKNNTKYANAISQILSSGVNDIKAILWYQGERDIVNGISAAAYQTAISLMLDNFQTDTGFSTMKMVSANIALYGAEDDASINAIRAAHINRWVNDADIHPGPTGHDQSFADSLHWATDAEATTLANRWWRTIDAALFGGTEAARGPQFSSATRSGTTVTVTFTGGEGNLANQTDQTGFVFTDNGTPITINSAAANGTNAVDLTLASTPSGTELISFAQGNDGIGATLQDSGTYPLPPEPFVDEAVS